MLLREKSQSQKDHLCEVPKVVTLMEVENRTVVVEDWMEDEMVSYGLTDSFNLEYEYKSFERYGEDSCITM